jgi:hypothetical protein
MHVLVEIHSRCVVDVFEKSGLNLSKSAISGELFIGHNSRYFLQITYLETFRNAIHNYITYYTILPQSHQGNNS